MTTDSAGFPPLAVVYLNVPTNLRASLREALQEFARNEQLEFLEGSFSKQGRQVDQFYPKKNGRPVAYIDNFRNPLRYEATAYSSAGDDVWKPRWNKLLLVFRSSLGSQGVSE